jgi:hypothetical protein
MEVLILSHQTLSKESLSHVLLGHHQMAEESTIWMAGWLLTQFERNNTKVEMDVIYI